SQALDAPVVPMCAARGQGLDALRQALDSTLSGDAPVRTPVDIALQEASGALAHELTRPGRAISTLEASRALIDAGGYAETRLLKTAPEAGPRIAAIREELGQGRSLATLEARNRYSWINAIVNDVEQRATGVTRHSDRIDRVLNHPVLGSALFVFTMAVIFQSVFAWAAPLMESIDGWSAALGAFVSANVASPLLASFLTDGVIAGVGSVLVFLPQIIILFAFIILLEDTGYMSRAAFLMDRLMRWCGLSGQSFIPMLSSFACAVPGIMGTRVIPGARDRIATIIAAPFMTCSARLPVYALLIAAFVPPHKYLGGWVNLQGLVLLGFYLIGMVAGILTAFLLHRTILRGPTASFLLELPPYRMPNLRSVLIKLYGRALIFLKRAGTIIFSIAIVIWFLASFPQATPMDDSRSTPQAQALHRQTTLEQSYLGTASKTVAPLFEPLGWDWKVTAAVIASFPAREVVIAVLGTLYAIDADDDGSLIDRIKQSRWPDGRLVFSLPMALGLMMFYALCLQCVATIAVMRRETNTWRWPLFAWVYMTALGYVGALLCYQIGSALSAA
ncbi:MAG: ferrous iron transport protein B, partial [Gammaproteobacteria bacterium]